jgi:Phage terminase large subunit
VSLSILKIPTAKIFEPLLQPSRYKSAWGGRGSGKSHFFGEMLVEACQAEKGMLAVCIREAQKTLAQSSKRLIESKINSLGIGHRFKSFSDRIETPGDGMIIFRGMQYVDPNPGLFYRPNPLLPKHWNKDLNASVQSPGDSENAFGLVGSDIYSQLLGPVANPVLVGDNFAIQSSPPLQAGGLPDSGNPAQPWTGNNPQTPLFDPAKPPPPFDPSNYDAPLASGSIGEWIRSL